MVKPSDPFCALAAPTMCRIRIWTGMSRLGRSCGTVSVRITARPRCIGVAPNNVSTCRSFLISKAITPVRTSMKDFRELKVWDRAHQLVLAVYQTTISFPPDETYGLTAQIRPSASSIPSNLAEGCGRDGDAELARFCLI